MQMPTMPMLPRPIPYYATTTLIVFVFLSGQFVFSFQKSPLHVAKAFLVNMGRKSRSRFGRPLTDSVKDASRESDLEPTQEENSVVVLSQPCYKIADKDLSASWIDLVRQNMVSASMTLPSTTGNPGDIDNERAKNNDKEAESPIVEYGIRLVEKESENPRETEWMFSEYVRQLGLESENFSPNPLISNMNATLNRIQQQRNGSGVDFRRVGNFVVQLQLVRTLRPPPSEGFQEATTSHPPPYNPKTDSFVTGPLRLECRPLISRLRVSATQNNFDDDNVDSNLLATSWDVFHNISPADKRGHFLLLPSLIDRERNWRGQYLTKEDCHDLVYLASTIDPVGSMFLGYNSVGAGASQNHIHCHLWPYPRIDPKSGSIEEEPKEDTDNFIYAASKVDAIYDSFTVGCSKIEVSHLVYPVFCLKMSSSIANLDMLGKCLASALEAIDEAPHNVGLFNRFHPMKKDENKNDTEQNASKISPKNVVDVFIFARSKERSSTIPTLKLGISEMMGIFHAQSEAQLEALTKVDAVPNTKHGNSERKCTIEQALADVSFENEKELWDRIVAKLATLN